MSPVDLWYHRSAVSDDNGRVFLKLASLVLFVAFFCALNNLVFRVRVPVGVFHLNMLKKALKNYYLAQY